MRGHGVRALAALMVGLAACGLGLTGCGSGSSSHAGGLPAAAAALQARLGTDPTLDGVSLFCDPGRSGRLICDQITFTVFDRPGHLVDYNYNDLGTGGQYFLTGPVGAERYPSPGYGPLTEAAEGFPLRAVNLNAVPGLLRIATHRSLPGGSGGDVALDLKRMELGWPVAWESPEVNQPVSNLANAAGRPISAALRTNPLHGGLPAIVHLFARQHGGDPRVAAVEAEGNNTVIFTFQTPARHWVTEEWFDGLFGPEMSTDVPPIGGNDRVDTMPLTDVPLAAAPRILVEIDRPGYLTCCSRADVAADADLTYENNVFTNGRWAWAVNGAWPPFVASADGGSFSGIGG